MFTGDRDAITRKLLIQQEEKVSPVILQVLLSTYADLRVVFDFSKVSASLEKT